MVRRFIIDLILFSLISIIVFVGILSGWKVGFFTMVLSLFFLIILKFFSCKPFKKRPIIIKMYGFLCLANLLSCFYAVDISFSFDVIWKMIGTYFIMIIFYNYFTTIKDVRKIIFFFILNLFALAVYNIIYYESNVSREMAYGGTNPLALQMFISIVLCIFLSLNGKKFFLILLPVYFFVLFLTESQKSTISLIIVFFIYMLLQLRYQKITTFVKYLFVAIVIFFVAISLLINSSLLQSSTERTFATVEAISTGEKVRGAAGGAVGEGLRSRLKTKGWEYFSESPFIGYGTNNFRALYGRETNFYTYSHYTPIELVIGVGFIGFFIYYSIYAILLIYIFKALMRNRYNTYAYLIAYIIAFMIIGLYMQIYFDIMVQVMLVIAFSYVQLKEIELKYN